jgi:Transposase DDE domain
VAQCGTHAIVDAVLGPVATGEQTLAAALITRLTPGMLVLADRNFYSYQAWQQTCATGAALLWRVSGRLALPILRALPDGSYRSLLINPKIRGRRREMLLAAAAAGEHLQPTQATLIRVIEHMIEDRPGSAELFCLITTITDQQLAPAVDLAAAYHQRWEIELSFDEIEIHQTGHLRVLRSRTPELVKQEIWALLLTHYAIRHIMKDATDTVGTDPDDLSFTRSYRAIRRQVTNQAGFSP